MDNFNCTSLYQATNNLPTLTLDEEKLAEDEIIKFKEIGQDTEDIGPALDRLYEATVKMQRQHVSWSIRKQMEMFPWLLNVSKFILMSFFPHRV